MKELVVDHPGFCMMNKIKIEDFIEWSERRKDPELQSRVYGDLTRSLCVCSGNEFVKVGDLQEWLLENMTKECITTRKHKQKQLWLSGVTGCGKSRLVATLKKFYRGYEVPSDGRWYDDYDEENIDFCYFEEFHGEKTIGWMNQFLEGTTMKLSRRGRPSVEKRKNMPVIVLSQLPVQSIYNKASGIAVEALQARVTAIDFYQPFQMDASRLVLN